MPYGLLGARPQSSRRRPVFAEEAQHKKKSARPFVDFLIRYAMRYDTTNDGAGPSDRSRDTGPLRRRRVARQVDTGGEPVG